MKKRMGLMMALAISLACVAQAAPALRQLPWQMGVKYGATHALEFTYADLTTTSTNTTMVFTNTIAAPAGVQFVGMLLDQPFDSATQTNVFSMTLSCGTADSTTRWISSKQVATDGTEVRTSFGTVYTATLTTESLTNLLKTASAAGIVVSNVTDAAVVTGVTVTQPLSEQTANVVITTTFGTAGSDRNHAEFESGRVRLFFRIWTPGMD